MHLKKEILKDSYRMRAKGYVYEPYFYKSFIEEYFYNSQAKNMKVF